MSHFLSNMDTFGKTIKQSGKIGVRALEGATWGAGKASQVASDGAYKIGGAALGMLGNNAQAFRDNLTFKNIGRGAIFSGAMYGFMGYMSDNPQNAASDRMVNIGKHGIAAAADVGADTAFSAAALGLSMFGPLGVAAGAGLMAYNFVGNLIGIDAGSVALNVMNHFDERYEQDTRGTKFNMTENTSMALQRQVSNLQGAGSNLGEMMHN